jgi:hypothetical protein
MNPIYMRCCDFESAKPKWQNSTGFQDDNRDAELLADYRQMMELAEKLQNSFKGDEKLVNKVVEEVRTSRYCNKNRKVSIKKN